MKKIIYLLFSALAINGSVLAQKKASNIKGTPSPAVLIKPDLIFNQIPILINGANGIEAVAGIPGRVIIPLSLVIENIGNLTSKPCKVQLSLEWKGALSRAEVEGGRVEPYYNRVKKSETMELQAIEKGKLVLRTQNFTFASIPDEVWDKRVRLTAEIIYPDYNGEISRTNNYSERIEFDLKK
jgi:hypothetical protein